MLHLCFIYWLHSASTSAPPSFLTFSWHRVFLSHLDFICFEMIAVYLVFVADLVWFMYMYILHLLYVGRAWQRRNLRANKWCSNVCRNVVEQRAKANKQMLACWTPADTVLDIFIVQSSWHLGYPRVFSTCGGSLLHVSLMSGNRWWWRWWLRWWLIDGWMMIIIIMIMIIVHVGDIHAVDSPTWHLHAKFLKMLVTRSIKAGAEVWNSLVREIIVSSTTKSVATCDTKSRHQGWNDLPSDFFRSRYVSF